MGIKHVKGIKTTILFMIYVRLSDEWTKDIHKNNKYLQSRGRGKDKVPKFLQIHFKYDYASLLHHLNISILYLWCVA